MAHLKLFVPFAAAAGLVLAGCQGAGQKEAGGTIIGAVGGGLLGSQVGEGRGRLVATAVGAVAGAFLGKEIGRSLDNADRLAMGRTTQAALENSKTGRTSSWRNPDSGNSGTVTPRRTYQEASGRYCREYQQTITVGDKTEQAHGTACRQSDGTWRIAN